MSILEVSRGSKGVHSKDRNVFKTCSVNRNKNCFLSKCCLLGYYWVACGKASHKSLLDFSVSCAQRERKSPNASSPLPTFPRSPAFSCFLLSNLNLVNLVLLGTNGIPSRTIFYRCVTGYPQRQTYPGRQTLLCDHIWVR